MLWPLLLYFAIVIALAAGLITISRFIGEIHFDPAASEPFESGIRSEGSARVRLSARYYLIAMFFVVFDLESIFIFSWAVAAGELGWQGYAEIVFFVAVLIAALVYLWRIGALDWTPNEPHPRARIRSV